MAEDSQQPSKQYTEDDVRHDMQKNLAARIQAHKDLTNEAFPPQGTPQPAYKGSQCCPPDKEEK